MRVGTTTAAVLVVAVLSACGGDGGSGDVGAEVGAVAAAQGEGGEGSSSPPSSPAGEPGAPAEPGGSGGGDGSGPPAASPSTPCGEGAPDGPDDAPPPTTIPGSEPTEIPSGLMSEEMLPQFGALVVDVEPEGCIDIATRFRANQRVQMMTHADDGKYTHIEVFDPEGESIAAWETGEPETMEGWDFFHDTPLPADGVYVFRVTHREGSDEAFMIAFYGEA
jgi:hypothetical protein